MKVHRHIISTLVMVVLTGMPMLAFASNLEAKIRGERVNLRAKPEDNAEVVGQVSDGQSLKVLSMNDAWVEVVPPESVDFWIAGEFVTDDTVVVNKLNARAGAGINYTVVGTFNRGDKITRRGSFGEWVKVAAPNDARLWISRSFVEVVDLSAPIIPPVAAPAILPAAPEPAAPVAMEPGFPQEEVAPPILAIRDEEPSALPPADLRLIPLDGQGRTVQREGILKKSPTLFMTPPGTHRLVKREGNTIVTTAYLRGDVQRLNGLLEQNLLIKGREYWVERVKAPVIVIETIEKRSYF